MREWPIKTLLGPDDLQSRVNHPDISNNTANIAAITDRHERSSTQLHNVPSLRLVKNTTPTIHHRSSQSTPNTANYTGASHSTSTERVHILLNLPVSNRPEFKHNQLYAISFCIECKHE